MSNLAIEAAFANTPSLTRHRFKGVLTSTDQRAGDDRAVERLSLSSGGYLYKRHGTADRQQASAATEQRSLRVAVDQLVVNPMWLTGGSVAVSTMDGAVSPDYRVFEVQTERVHPRFLHHLLRSRPYLDQYNLFVRANTTFDRRIQQGDLDQLPLYLPPRDEQRRIADFLDDRVARIDKIVTARRAQLAAAKSWSAAELQALFDRLANDHGTGRLGYLLHGLEQGWSPQADSTPAEPEEWGVMRSGCVNDGLFRAEDNKRLPPELEPQTQYELRAGDLLMSRASGSLDKIGSVAIVPDAVRARLLLCDKIYRLAPAAEWRADYLAPMMRTHSNRELIRLGVSGAEGMANNLPSSAVRSLQIPLAPGVAQSAAAAAARDIAQGHDSLAVSITASIGLLTEYKQSLITAAVTGELDVTTAASGIPG